MSKVTDRKYRLSVKGSDLFLASGCMIAGLICANLFWVCNGVFDCKSFWPTISYMACFRGNDRLFSFTMTLQGTFLLVFFITAYANYSQFMNVFEKVMFGVLGVLISLAMPFIAMIDEANDSHILPLKEIHLGIMIGVISCSLTWTYLTYLCISKMDDDQKKQSEFLKNYILLGLGMLVMNLLEWYYREKNNWLFNSNAEALSEWLVVGLALFLPYVYSLTFSPVEISLRASSKQ